MTFIYIELGLAGTGVVNTFVLYLCYRVATEEADVRCRAWWTHVKGVMTWTYVSRYSIVVEAFCSFVLACTRVWAEH